MDDQTIRLLINVAVFGLVLSVWGIGVFFWLGRYLFKLKAVRRRLGLASEANKDSETLRLWRDMQLEQGPQDGQSKKVNLLEKVKYWIEDAGWNVPFRTVLLSVCVLSFIGFLVVYMLFGTVWLGLCGAFAVLFGFFQYADKRIIEQANLFERQLVDALGVAARSLRAGHPLVGAFQLIAEEVSKPVGPIFQRIHREQAFGNDMRDALKNAAEDNRNREFKLFATAVTVQMQSGGNLADLMDTLVSVTRARIWLNKRIRVLTAQVQFSKIVLIAMPILLMFALNVINPKYMEPLFSTSTGHLLLITMFVNLFLGAWLMNKMAKIDY
ncbi:MAG: type II secretion system F family protein [Planctomycetota bacterium]|jgi:tight adherence protein B